MSNAEIATKVRVGITQGGTYVGVIPPLENIEIAKLEELNLLDQSQIEEITKGPQCTLIKTSLGFSSRSGAIRSTQITALKIAKELIKLRGRVDLNLTPIEIFGPNSSPFNPHPKRLEH